MSPPNPDPVLAQLCQGAGDERPLSLLDLIERRTLDLELAAWLVSRVAGGCSWITGSGPGGIGKTTVMRSLLSFVPARFAFAEALPGQVGALGEPPTCVVSHELSDHTPPTYLWDEDLRDFFSLADRGCVLVGNVHADDAEEVRDQIVGSCGVTEARFRAVGLLAFLRMDGQDPEARRIRDATSRRFFAQIFWSDGHGAHGRVYTPSSGLSDGPHRDAEQERRYRAFLERSLRGDERDILTLRHAFLNELRAHV
jgi:hypothetical protein